MSTYIEDSELSGINQSNSSDWLPVSGELYAVLDAALAMSQVTDGAFDVSIGGLVNLWGFGPEPGSDRIPDNSELERRLANSGFQKIELRLTPRAVKKAAPGIYLDLSAIAKGYAVDRVAEYLEQAQIEHYLVDIGGEIRARGRNQSGQAWRIGIEKPLVDSREAGWVVGLENISMATSGDYRNFFMHEGRRYSHTIDPATGWPVSHPLVSVSVVSPSTMMADALATALLVMGPEKGFNFAETRAIPALFISRAENGFSEHFTSTFRPYLEN
jgi:thiamine biosynthesis lipoprotein